MSENMKKSASTAGWRGALSGPLESVRTHWDRAPGWERWAVYVLLVVGALFLPYEGLAPIMSPESAWDTILFYPIGIYVLLALGLNVVIGYAGMLDLGYVAFWAIGAYTMATMAVKHGIGFWPLLPCGIVLAAVSGVILGAPTLRLRGDYLAIVTLGFGEIVRKVAENTNWLGGTRGINNIPHPPSHEGVWLFGVDLFTYKIRDARPYYYLLVAVIVVVIIFSKRLEASRIGRSWTAIREDEDAAEIMGVPTFKFKLLSFATGAAIGGAAGVVFAAKTSYVAPANFPFLLSATILAAVVLGGAGNIPGVVVGAFLVAWLPERFRGLADYRDLAFGAILVAMMIFRPEGLIPSRQRKAEMAEGGGGMGHMGAEVDTSGSEAEVGSR
ncbi:branched-chain amino acid ABC transporter permease [Actinomadura sp. LD22]|uniref:Branched-chain amino acid ABC transporter permease n=1 Tax=Actinomadura physcomitrii TaxID=2650748 RepID=A0A6I4MYL7_9ACTN|nr:branched-chain amino acid ABC transporter permease [Actinomadura physcomitrii]MWA07446.1 branched-chain amino acid ABC transporter permease [Actinomadura physcomitrii]